MNPLDVSARLRDELVARGVVLRERAHFLVGNGADAHAAWQVFSALAAEPVYEPFELRGIACRAVDPTHDGDLLLFETSVSPRLPEKGWRSGSDPVEPDAFILHFTRQFSFDDTAGEYVGMNAVTLDIEFQPNPEVAALQPVQDWGCAGPPWSPAEWARRGEEARPYGAAAEWIERVEQSEAFRSTLEGGTPDRFYFMQSDV